MEIIIEKILITLSCIFIIVLTYVWRYVALSKNEERIIKNDKKIDNLYKKFRKILSKKGYRFIKHIPTILKITTKYLMAYNENGENCSFAIVYNYKKINFSDVCFLLDEFSKENNCVGKIIYINDNKKEINLEIIKEAKDFNVEVWDKHGKIVNTDFKKNIVNKKKNIFEDNIQRL